MRELHFINRHRSSQSAGQSAGRNLGRRNPARVRKGRSYVAALSGAMCAAALISGALPGCFSTPDGFDSPDPNKRLDAIIQSTKNPNPASQIPLLIEQLESLDPAARLLAIRALERQTGQTLGYDHAAPAWERSPAVRRWADWARENGYRSDPNEPL